MSQDLPNIFSITVHWESEPIGKSPCVLKRRLIVLWYFHIFKTPMNELEKQFLRSLIRPSALFTRNVTVSVSVKVRKFNIVLMMNILIVSEWVLPFYPPRTPSPLVQCQTLIVSLRERGKMNLCVNKAFHQFIIHAVNGLANGWSLVISCKPLSIKN